MIDLPSVIDDQRALLNDPRGDMNDLRRVIGDFRPDGNDSGCVHTHCKKIDKRGSRIPNDRHAGENSRAAEVIDQLGERIDQPAALIEDDGA